MAYLNLDVNYFEHIKTVRLIALLGRGAGELPIRLWAHCAKHHPDTGIFPGYSAKELEILCGWWGPEGEMVSAMVKLNLVRKVSKGWRVNDWDEHEGHLAAFKKRAENAAKIRWSKLNATSNATSIAKLDTKQSPYYTIPAVPTIPNQTHIYENSASPGLTATPGPATPAKIAEWFGKIWEVYPGHRRHGREAAFEIFELRVQALEDAKRCALDLEAYLKSVSEPKYLLKASRWFQEWAGGKTNDHRGSRTGVHDKSDVGRPDRGNAGPGVAPDTGEMLHKLADRTKFPEEPETGDPGRGEPRDE